MLPNLNNIMKKNPALYDPQYFHERDHLDLHIAESVKLLMRKHRLKSVLDVGCGTGRLVRFLNLSGFRAQGCDNQTAALKLARKINPPKNIVRASASRLPFIKSTFDLITSISVIEHLTPYQSQQFISASWRILKPRGYIFLITPNFVSPLRLILGKRWFGYSDPSHIQFFTPSSLANLLKLNGFGSVTCRLPTAYNVPFDWYLPVFFRKLPMPLKNLLNYLMISSPLSTWRDSFWILGQK